jgi:hypothetical protein
MKTSPHITCVPIGGLCNRMRAMASAVWMAERLNGEVTVYWAVNRDCGAAFSELFQSVEMLGVRVLEPTFWQLHLAFSRKKNLYFPGLLRWLCFSSQLVGTAECVEKRIPDGLLGNRPFVISGYSLSAHADMTKLFKPTEAIQTRINAITERFSDTTIGIHIRRGDNRQSIEHNSPGDYIGFMERQLLECPTTSFYIASDSPALKQELAARFPGSVIQNDAVLERHSVNGMKDAVVDLWCLAATNRIVGSYFSSYSDIATELGGIPLTIL